MRSLIAALYAAALLAYLPPAVACDENGCNNRPAEASGEVPQTRAMKIAKPIQECDENTCN